MVVGKDGGRMKLTLLIQPKIKQLILTPESEEEKAIFKMFPDNINVLTKRGSCFQTCKGGWVREFEDDDSLILVMGDI